MSHRILGFGVLVYAAFKSNAALDLVSITLGPWDAGRMVSSWVLLGNSVLWLAFVSGGVGLIFGKSWSRLVLLVAAAVSVVLGLLGMVFLSNWDMPLEVVSRNALQILPEFAILVGTLTLRRPASERAVSPSIDLAYGCFAWIAFVLCALPIALSLPLDFTTSQVLQMTVGFPVAMSTLAAGLAAVVLSIIKWREWPLMTMSAASISLFLVILAGVGWELVGEIFMAVWYVPVTALMVFFCIRWFAVTRRRARQVHETDKQQP